MYNVLIVSKNEDIRKEVAFKLRCYDLEILYANEITDAMEDARMKDNKYVNIAILDMNHYNMKGIEEVKALKQHFPNTKYIVISEEVESEYMRQGVNMGISGFMLKPIAGSDMHNIMDNVIKQLDREYEAVLLKKRMENIVEHLNADRINGQIVNCVKNCDEIIGKLFDTTQAIVESKNSDGPYCRSIIDHVKSYIEQNYYNKVTVKDMAKHFSMNANYLSTLFKNQVGKTITEYLTEIRVKKAIELLKHTEVGTAEIGEYVGYNDTQYFYRVFKKVTGRTTTDYRNVY